MYKLAYPACRDEPACDYADVGNRRKYDTYGCENSYYAEIEDDGEFDVVQGLPCTTWKGATLMDREDIQLIHDFIGGINANLMEYALRVALPDIDEEKLIKHKRRLIQIYAKLDKELDDADQNRGM